MTKKTIDKKLNKLTLLLVIILIFGFLLRFLGVYPGYSPYHPDEGKAGYSSAWYMFINKTLDLPHYHYPALIPLIELIYLVSISIPILWVKLFLTNPDLILSHLNNLPDIFQNYIALRSDVLIMFLSRYLMVIFGFLTMIITYLVSKTLFSSRLISLLSVLILAVNLRAVTSSQLDLPDGYSSFFLILAFYFIVKLKENPTLKYYVLSAVCIGLAISSKLQFFSLVPFIIVYFYHAIKEKNIFFKELFFWLLFLIFTVVLINIGPLSNFWKFYETMSRQSDLYGFGINKLGLGGLSYFYHIILTPTIAFLFLIGIVMGLLRYKFSTVLVLSVVAFYLYYFLFLTRGWFYPRNFVSIIPFFAILAGLGLTSIWDLIKHYVKNRNLAIAFFICIISIVLFESTKNSLIHTINYMKPWNIISMRQCIRQNILSGKTVAAHPTDKYILFSLPSTDVDKKLKFIPLDFESNYSVAELQEDKADYAILGLDMIGDRNSVWWMTKTNYWKKPNEISNNIFVSLAAQELFTSAVCTQVKPWQAVENNYVFVSIPPTIDLKWQEISREQFNQEVGNFKKIGNNLIWDEKEGKRNQGSLEIKAINPPLPVARWVSPTFSVRQGEFYKVEGWVKGSTNLEKKRRDGFLRLDFYREQPLIWDESTESLITNLSSRYFGQVGWKKLVVVGVAPPEATLATVSFQVSDFSVSNFWLDDLVIYQSDAKSILNNSSLLKKGNQKLKLDPDVFVPNLGSGY